MSDRPLTDKRVLVTRTEKQAKALASKMESLGAETVKLPLIRIEPSENEAILDVAIEKTLAGIHGKPAGNSALSRKLLRAFILLTVSLTLSSLG